MNNRGIPKYLLLFLAILLLMWGLIGLSGLGFDVPFLRQAIGFIFLTFIPGFLILRILKFNNLTTAETLIYSIGLSIGFVMLTGLFMNSLYPYLGISRPISLLPSTITFTIFTIILSGIAYIRDKGNRSLTVSLPEIKHSQLSPYLFLLMLPILAIAGALVNTAYQNNIILLILIPLIAIVPVLVAFNKFIPEKAFDFAIIMIAVSLVLHMTLISMYPLRWGVDEEYYWMNLVIQNGSWNYVTPNTVNSTLPIVLMGPIYSLILNMDSIWLFKIVYPLLFSLLPLTLFQVFKNQVSARFAFLAVFFLMAMSYFYNTGILLRREEIALLFFALLILLLVDKKLGQLQKAFLAIIFSFSLVVSHYTVGYTAVFFLVGAWALYSIMTSKFFKPLWGRLAGSPDNLGDIPPGSAQTPYSALLRLSFVFLFIAIAWAWYSYVTSGKPITTFIWTSFFVAKSLTQVAAQEAKSVYTMYAFGQGFFSVPLRAQIFLLLQYITELFIVVGFVRLIRKPGRFRADYIAFCGVAFLMLLAFIIAPYVSNIVGMVRMYFITLIVLSPLFVLGGATIWEGILGVMKKVKLKTSASPMFLILAVLIPYFLYSIGFIPEVTKEFQQPVRTRHVPCSVSLDYGKVDSAHYNEQEVASARWLAGAAGDDLVFYGDSYSFNVMAVTFTSPVIKKHTLWMPYLDMIPEMPDSSYIYFRTWTLKELETFEIFQHEKRGETSLQDYLDTLDAIEARDKIYDNGGAQVLGPANTYPDWTTQFLFTTEPPQ